MSRPIFVAATRQHVGKTTVSLALMSGLKKRFDKVGFIKPGVMLKCSACTCQSHFSLMPAAHAFCPAVGQQHIAVNDEAGNEVRVDKDCQVMKEFFNLDHLSYTNMSPVIIPKGYTAKYIDGKVTMAQQVEKIMSALDTVSGASDTVMLEGTGHVGVGSIVELSNAKAAALCGADVLLVANGGLGSAFDELEMNRQMFAAEGVRVRGVVLNKVRPDKVDKVRDYFERLLRARWGVPLLGVVPDLPFLGKANLGEIERMLDAQLLGGHRCRSLHYGQENSFLVTTGLRRFLRRAFQQREETWRRPLFVTHVTRDDILLGFLAHHLKSMTKQRDSISGPDDWAGAMVLSIGASKAFPDLAHSDLDPNASESDKEMLPYLQKMVEDIDAPVMITKAGTLDVLERIKSFTAKHNVNDEMRISAAIDHYEPHIDFDTMLNNA
jgi:BioD-like phosphotransacetylase family protein